MRSYFNKEDKAVIIELMKKSQGTMSNSAFAKKAGVSPSYITRCYKGDFMPSIEVLSKMTGRSLDDLKNHYQSNLDTVYGDMEPVQNDKRLLFLALLSYLIKEKLPYSIDTMPDYESGIFEVKLHSCLFDRAIFYYVPSVNDLYIWAGKMNLREEGYNTTKKDMVVVIADTVTNMKSFEEIFSSHSIANVGELSVVLYDSFNKSIEEEHFVDSNKEFMQFNMPDKSITDSNTYIR